MGVASEEVGVSLRYWSGGLGLGWLIGPWLIGPWLIGPWLIGPGEKGRWMGFWDWDLGRGLVLGGRAKMRPVA
jgi:hypothetical protein